ncbi:M16 family metallopeptidase [Pedobacter alpinus]|uniref:M16 family metallopeptidase n=1 Tax=Pedobacter alpinus TaxID=1590643 RepID=A0ABW5TU37_9SPHI
MLDRTIAPNFKQIEDVKFVKAAAHYLKNNIPVYIINAGDQDLVSVEFIFQNISWDTEKPLLPRITNSLLTEGTSTLTAAQIADNIDYYGAYYQTAYSNDKSSLTLFSLNKNLANTLPIIKELLVDAIFPDNELQTFLRNEIQHLKINLEKNAVIARREFNKALFGNSAYGYASVEEDYQNVNREDLLAHYKTVYQPANCTIIISGKVEENTIAILEALFGNWESDAVLPAFNVALKPTADKLVYTEKKDALQSAIRIGIPTINRTHQDFISLQILNTILGGYFGSRLMANIREDKGYTYGIGSGVATLQHAGYFFISTEVGVDVTKSTLEEIEKEVNLLKTELVAEDELQLVKNYLMGSLLGSLENAFSHAEKFKNLHFYGLGYDYYERYIKTVKSITPKELMTLANKYWNYNEFYKIIVGKM